MPIIHHLNCGSLRLPFMRAASCHCLLLEYKNELALIDIGFGMAEVQNPVERIGQTLIDAYSIEFDERYTALRQIQNRGLQHKAVTHCIISHLDFDHAGGLADFPDALVHLSEEEYQKLRNGSSRYLPIQFAHDPKFKRYGPPNTYWFGLPARKLEIDFGIDIFLIPLFGHTSGHCGVAINAADKWTFYVGDAFFTGMELLEDDHAVTQAAVASAENSQQCLENFRKIKRLSEQHPEIEIFCYHDPAGFKSIQTQNIQSTQT